MAHLVKRGADSCKLVMGIPIYARTFTLMNPENHVFGAPCKAEGLPGSYTNEPGFIAFYEVTIVIWF